MRQVALVGVLAIALVLAGCPSDGDATGTLTPAAVPEVPTEPPTATPLPELAAECDVPAPSPPPDDLPKPEAGAASIILDDGAVDAGVIADRHEAVLANYRYRLAATDRSIYVTENRSAFRATVRTDVASVAHYAVDGTRYTYYFDDGGRARFGVAEYIPGPSTTTFGGSISLTGRPTVERVLSAYPHRVAAVREDGWTVLRATRGDLTESEAAGLASLNSTVLVDRRGVVRRIETRVTVDPASSTTPPLARNVSLGITGIGEVSFGRPDWVCTAVDRLDERGTATPDE